MRILKWIGFGLLGIIILLTMVSFFTPTEYSVERSSVIQSTEDRVFYSINQWSEFAEWSPWSDIDPSMQITIEGVDGTIGSIYHWKGNKDAGAGKMVKTESIPNQQIAYDLIFTEPFESKAKSWMTMTPGKDGIKLTWGMNGTMSRPMNIMLLMMDMNAEIGKDFEKGLNRIKEKLETTSFNATEILLPEMNLIYLEAQSNINEINSIIKSSFNDLERFTMMSGLKTSGSPMAIYNSWSENAISVSLAIPVEIVPDKIDGQFKTMTMPAIFALKSEYKGGFNSMEGFYDQFMRYLETNSYEKTDRFIEEYITNTELEKDSAKWITNVYMEVKPKQAIQ